MDFKNGTELILLRDTYGCLVSEIMKHRECIQTDTTREALDERIWRR